MLCSMLAGSSSKLIAEARSPVHRLCCFLSFQIQPGNTSSKKFRKRRTVHVQKHRDDIPRCAAALISLGRCSCLARPPGGSNSCHLSHLSASHSLWARSMQHAHPVAIQRPATCELENVITEIPSKRSRLKKYRFAVECVWHHRVELSIDTTAPASRSPK